nr:MAG TPA: hypothetical protein [Caudoviricetes sp.]
MNFNFFFFIITTKSLYSIFITSDKYYHNWKLKSTKIENKKDFTFISSFEKNSKKKEPLGS